MSLQKKPTIQDPETLVQLALALTRSSSRVEDHFWEKKLEHVMSELLSSGQQALLDDAIELLKEEEEDGESYHILGGFAESCAESIKLQVEGQTWNVLLIAAPLLAWTRYRIPSGPLKNSLMKTLTKALQSNVFAKEVRTAFVPYLYSIDQLPRSHCATWELTKKLGESAISGTELPADFEELPETAAILADPRFLLVAVAAKADAPLFQWQEDVSKVKQRRALSEKHWSEQVKTSLTNVLTGCEFETILPGAYHAACREADRRIRPYTLRTAVRYLEDILDTQAVTLRAVIAGVGETDIEEYRIGFSRRSESQIIYGVVWPIYGRVYEDGDDASVNSLVNLLKELGISDIRTMEGLFNLEVCDDCGMPLYVNASGETMHAEMPEEVDPSVPQLH